VARLYAVGHSYREIAELLGSSPNTVRVQLARVYQKLDINDKARLASALEGR
jgi:DNA-binding CsgD family transcriptional regulator